MPAWLTSIIELLVGLVCLGAAWGAWVRLRSPVATALIALAGLTAAGHAVWMLVTS
ncbi:MAG: hypothetical protein QOG88_480 [Actinomycetota bacterium]|jgi:hypothetical protein|nr:hypothetical protein [Actinomycetota bacterium]